MSEIPRAIQGTYADFKFVKTRSVVQIIVEVPIEAADDAFGLLGMPTPGSEQWVAVALLQKPKGTQEKEAKPKRQWDDMPPQSQVAMKCDEPDFQQWIFKTVGPPQRVELEDSALEAERRVKSFCGVERKRDIEKNQKAREHWDYLVTQFRADTQRQAEQRG